MWAGRALDVYLCEWQDEVQTGSLADGEADESRVGQTSTSACFCGFRLLDPPESENTTLDPSQSNSTIEFSPIQLNP